VGDIPVAKPSPIPRTLRFPRRGSAIALVLAGFVALVVAAAIAAYPTGSNVDQITVPQWVTVERADDLQPDQPVHIFAQKLWLVRQPSGDVLALYDVSPSVERCGISWRPELPFRNQTGWLRSACHGDTYDLTGTCVYECPRDMDRYQTRVVGGDVQICVGPRALIEGTVRDPSMIATHATNAELAHRRLP